MSPRSWKLPHGVKTIEVNGYEMAYLERGQGTPLVLVHGSLSDFRAWALQMEPFSADYQTIAVSLRHCYPEYWDGEGAKFSVRQHADDLSVFVKKLNSGPVHLVAHSRGGDVALILAAKHPKLVRSMVLADPAPLNNMLPATPEVTSAVEKRKAFVTAAIERLQQGNWDGGLEIFTDAVSAPGNWKKLSESAKQIRRDNAWSLKSLVTDAQDKFICTDAKKIDVPVLLVTGDKSPRFYGMMHAALQSCLKNQQKVTISNASHGMNRENPEAFNAVVIDFLTKNMAQQLREAGHP
jgi:esterase